MPREKRRNFKPIDWENIEIAIVPIDEPNPHNPYSELTPEERFLRLQELYAEIYEKRLTRIMQENDDK